MNINTNYCYAPITYINRNLKINQSAYNKTAENTVECTKQNNSELSKFDPSNCTFDEFCSTVKSFYKDGKLTGHDVLLGTIDFERGIKEINPNFKYYITSNDSNGRKNWVDEFDALAAREFNRGNMLGYKRNMERKEVAMKVAELINKNI